MKIMTNIHPYSNMTLRITHGKLTIWKFLILSRLATILKLASNLLLNVKHRRRLRGGLGARATPGNCYRGAEPPLRNVQKFALYRIFSLISRVGIASSSIFNE